MKKTSILITVLFVISLLVCACGDGNSKKTSEPASEESPKATVDTALVGNWKEDIFDSGFLFNADGTGTDTFWDLTFTYSCENGEVLIVYDTEEYGASKYTYTVSGDSLSMTRIDEEETSAFTYTKAAMPETEATTAPIETGESDSQDEP